MGARRRMTTGLQLLELWSVTVGQLQRNQVYDALFAIADGTALEIYDVLGGTRTGELLFVVRPGLVIKVCLSSATTFGLLYIGAPGDAPPFPDGIDIV